MKAKKSLGQNFLKSKQAIRDIVKAAELHSEDTVLEVGPGRGVLTEALLESGTKVIAIEKDDELIPVLEEKFKDEIKNGKLEIIHDDVLKMFEIPFRTFLKGKYKIVANIPYYITGQFLRMFLESNNQPERMVLMLQKEVARRIVASDKKESILSMSVKAYGTPKYIGTVEAKYFSPAPNVDSAILLISNISKKFFIENDIGEEKFFEIMKAGFAHKRKMLLGNLKTSTKGIAKEINWEKIFEETKIPRKTRAEDISLDDWKMIIAKV